MEKIKTLFDNKNIALVIVISLKERCILLKIPSPSWDIDQLPHSSVIDTYINIIVTAALPFESITGPSPSQGCVSPITSPAKATLGTLKTARVIGAPVAEEPWLLLKLNTREWEITAYRQDPMSMIDSVSDGLEVTGKGSGDDHFVMVTFSVYRTA
eukprot:Tbor_TRINITY_DN5691_c2_g6::TRINITY_DN5691_c2_g6_i2::g.8951::m.8951